VLNDIANVLGLSAKYTIDYTKQLPIDKGFKSVEFDLLPNSFDISGNENRGYLLTEVEVNENGIIEEPVEVEGIDGAVVYHCNPQEHFSPFTAKSKILPNNPYLLGSKQFGIASKLNDGDSVQFVVDDIGFTRVFKIDTSLKGTIALNPTYDMGLSTALLSSYRFSRLEKIGS